MPTIVKLKFPAHIWMWLVNLGRNYPLGRTVNFSPPFVWQKTRHQANLKDAQPCEREDQRASFQV